MNPSNSHDVSSSLSFWHVKISDTLGILDGFIDAESIVWAPFFDVATFVQIIAPFIFPPDWKNILECKFYPEISLITSSLTRDTTVMYEDKLVSTSIFKGKPKRYWKYPVHSTWKRGPETRCKLTEFLLDWSFPHYVEKWAEEEEFKHVYHKNFRPHGFPLIDVEFIMCDGSSWCARIKGKTRHIYWGDQEKLSMGGVWNLFGEMILPTFRTAPTRRFRTVVFTCTSESIKMAL